MIYKIIYCYLLSNFEAWVLLGILLVMGAIVSRLIKTDKETHLMVIGIIVYSCLSIPLMIVNWILYDKLHHTNLSFILLLAFKLIADFVCFISNMNKKKDNEV